ncbi:MAG: amidohydrolase family protein [Chloroflexia bacterium]|nr:amidohydrolase family protein [Chloroflexia bacterium]
MPDLRVIDIGTIVSGHIDAPVVDGNTVVVQNGTIAYVGDEHGAPAPAANEVTIDAAGATLIPGLIDNHVHPVIGDFSPRQRVLDFIESCLHGGVTSMISAGEPHVPGRPRDRAGTKALAILAAKSFANARPGGVKVIAGAVILEHGLTEADFDEMADAGVQLVGEIGLSAVCTEEEAGPMVRWAQARGLRVAMHTGGVSIPGSNAIRADLVIAIRPDVASHVNGGPTRLPLADVERILNETDCFVEIVQCGNTLAAQEVARLIASRGDERRLILGTDMPSGTGVIPLGMLRTIAWVASMGRIAPARAVAMATGNTARLHGLNRGIIAPGREGDLVIVDAPIGSGASSALETLAIGDTPAVAAVIVDGEVKIGTSRNTPPGQHNVVVPGFAGGGH